MDKIDFKMHYHLEVLDISDLFLMLLNIFYAYKCCIDLINNNNNKIKNYNIVI